MRTEATLSLKTNPILITGSHRSGTTWLGKTIASAPGTYYLGEVFNPDSGLLQGMIDGQYHYVTVGEHHLFTTAMGRILNYDYAPRFRKREFLWLPSRIAFYRLTRRLLNLPRPILKDPIAAMSAEWLATTFDMDVVCVIRHPVAFVLSLNKAGWNYDPRFFARQPTLLDEWLYPYRNLLIKPPVDVLEGGSVMWLCIYHVLSAYIARNPRWQTWRLEDIALDPERSFRTIYDRLGLSFTSRTVRYIRENSATTNVIDAPSDDPHLIRRNSRALRDRWRTMFDTEDVLRIRRIVEPVSAAFYSDEDW